MSEFLGKLSTGLADALSDVLENLPDTSSKDQALRKLLAKHAPCPVPNAQWSLINSIDYDFEGFSSRHLSDHATVMSLKSRGKVSAIPNLVVVRDMCLAAKLAYEEPSVIEYFCEKWNMSTVAFPRDNLQSAQAYVMYDKENIILSFRGTELLNFKDWSSDFNSKLVQMTSHSVSGSPHKKEIYAHAGFLDLLGVRPPVDKNCSFSQMYSMLAQMLLARPRKLWISGHSLGGALASVFVAQLLLNDDPILENLAGLYTYGQPRCGDGQYCKLFVDLEKKGLVYRTVYKTDVVTRVPLRVQEYAHHGCRIDIETDTTLLVWHEGEQVKIDRQRTSKKDSTGLQKDSMLKKIVFTLLPDFLEDHYPCQYIRGVELFIRA